MNAKKVDEQIVENCIDIFGSEAAAYEFINESYSPELDSWNYGYSFIKVVNAEKQTIVTFWVHVD